jgi:hypothetical protein
MGVAHHLLVGPYAEFRVLPGHPGRFSPEDEDGDPLCWETLVYSAGPNERLPEWFRYGPGVQGRSDTPRAMYFTDRGGVFPPDQDLSNVDREAEMNWFAATFREELRLLSEHFGAPPRIRWGIVFWVT